MAILRFSSRKLERFFETGSRSEIQPNHASKLERILDRLDASNDIRDMDFPGSGLHKLTGRLKGFWAVKVSGNYRVWFKFENKNAYDVNYGDYH
jgi:toxin HigB-1